MGDVRGGATVDARVAVGAGQGRRRQRRSGRRTGGYGQAVGAVPGAEEAEGGAGSGGECSVVAGVGGGHGRAAARDVRLPCLADRLTVAEGPADPPTGDRRRTGGDPYRTLEATGPLPDHAVRRRARPAPGRWRG